MTDPKKPNPLPSVLTYDDVRAVSPALEYYTKGPLLDSLWKRPDPVTTGSKRRHRVFPHRTYPNDRDAISLCVGIGQRCESE